MHPVVGHVAASGRDFLPRPRQGKGARKIWPTECCAVALLHPYVRWSLLHCRRFTGSSLCSAVPTKPPHPHLLLAPSFSSPVPVVCPPKTPEPCRARGPPLFRGPVGGARCSRRCARQTTRAELEPRIGPVPKGRVRRCARERGGENRYPSPCGSLYAPSCRFALALLEPRKRTSAGAAAPPASPATTTLTTRLSPRFRGAGRQRLSCFTMALSSEWPVKDVGSPPPRLFPASSLPYDVPDPDTARADCLYVHCRRRHVDGLS